MSNANTSIDVKDNCVGATSWAYPGKQHNIRIYGFAGKKLYQWTYSDQKWQPEREHINVDIPGSVFVGAPAVTSWLDSEQFVHLRLYLLDTNGYVFEGSYDTNEPNPNWSWKRVDPPKVMAFQALIGATATYLGPEAEIRVVGIIDDALFSLGQSGGAWSWEELPG